MRVAPDLVALYFRRVHLAALVHVDEGADRDVLLFHR